jgi:hypothetical protein
MYGAGMPILFPIACWSLSSLYLLEKFALYYVYQAPPAYDERLNNAVLEILKYAPLILLSFGFWILSNKQLRENGHLLPIDDDDQAVKSDHLWYIALTPVGLYDTGPASTLLIFFFLYGFYLLTHKAMTAAYYTFIKCFNSDRCTHMFAPGLFVEELDLDEEIDLY